MVVNVTREIGLTDIRAITFQQSSYYWPNSPKIHQKGKILSNSKGFVWFMRDR
jgi:hypothetical protein